MTTVYTVTTEFSGHADALALRDIIRELGFEASVTHHTLEAGPRKAAKDTRLGKVILRHMAPSEGCSPKSFHTEDIAMYIEGLDYSPLSASGMLSMLCDQGSIKRVSPATFTVA